MKIAKEIKDKSLVTKEEWREYTLTVWNIPNVSNSDHPAVFPEEIPHRLIKLFSFWGETILDPFAGIGTTAIAAINNCRKPICVDQSAKYVKLMENNLRHSLNGKSDIIKQAQLVKHDSRNLDFIEDDSIGLIVTSPPYWDKADYGRNKINLGKKSGYIEFLKKIEPAFLECFRVLRPGRKLCLVTANVNQYTNHGLLTFPLSTDFTNLLREIGFVMINEIIWNKNGTGGKWGSYGNQRPIFGSYPYPPNFLFKNVHEYILIFSKPPEKPKKGSKVRLYEDLMELPEEFHSRIMDKITK